MWTLGCWIVSVFGSLRESSACKNNCVSDLGKEGKGWSTQSLRLALHCWKGGGRGGGGLWEGGRGFRTPPPLIFNYSKEALGGGTCHH